MEVDEHPAEGHIITEFQRISKQLVDIQDKFEKITKISRDTTIESKRVIFAVHAVAKEKDDIKRNEEIKKIATRLKKMVEHNFKNIALELRNEDPYMFHRAYTYGVQEYIEALTYFKYICCHQLITWEEIVEECKFTIETKPEDDGKMIETETISLMIPLSDYILGVQDMTGEVMRFCILSLGAGDLVNANYACNFVKYVYTALHTFQGCHKQFYFKLDVAGQSVNKMEYGCYMGKMREVEKAVDKR